MSAGQTTQMGHWLDRLRGGEVAACDELVNVACERLRRMTRKMLRSYPRVARWEQTDDVWQNAALRLCRALNAAPPQSVRHFLNLAALHIRRELLDLARHHGGPQSAAARHDTGRDLSGNPAPEDPDQLERWTEFHQQIEALPTEERELFNLLWYNGVSQTEAAEVLGLSERTLQRRWQAARQKLFAAMKGELPD